MALSTRNTHPVSKQHIQALIASSSRSNAANLSA
jgi:hypothetical protein